MGDDISDKRRRSKKKRSSLSTWKKKFNIKKRFTNKLPVHGRHIRALMSGWPVSDVRSVLTQYEITGMLKQLSIMADKSRVACSSLEEDLGHVYSSQLCCDIRIVCCQHAEEGCDSATEDQEYLAHSALVASRWPLIKTTIKTQLGEHARRSYHEDTEIPLLFNASVQTSRHSADIARALPTIYVTDILPKKFSEIMKEAYFGSGNHERNAPRKLQPLPTTDESFHLRNKSVQPFSNRHTILECEQPAVPRRHVRRKQKQRFSMDERVLVNLSPGATSSRVQQTPCKFPQSEIMHGPMYNPYAQSFHLNSSPEKSIMHSGKDIPNSLHDDLMRMFKEAEAGFGDLKIIFSSDSSSNFTPWMTPHSRRRDFSNHYQAWISHYESSNFYSPTSSREWQNPLFCHRVILAARSLYFRRLIHKQMSSNLAEASSSLTTLELEGSVIPPRYMGVVLYAMYTDKVDIHKLYERTGLGIHMGGGNPFYLRDAMMLHHIGCFIEFPRLMQGCEEIIVNSLDQNNLLQILHWTSLSHGSQWVRRQVNVFMREKFSELLASGVLFELGASQLTEVLRSDFVNAAELDILKCALRWGEHELLRRIEEREPNLLTHTAHSISRSKTASARRRELIASRVEELHDCTAPVLACVRMQHLLPPNHELFTNAVKRGVISRPPADLLENVNEGNVRQWMKSRADFVPPRLHKPYVDETRNILDERFAQDTDCVSLRSVHNLSRDQPWCSGRHHVGMNTHVIPDALYMVGRARLPTRRRYRNQEPHQSFLRSVSTAFQRSPPTKYIGNYYPVPEPPVMRELFNRERELRSTSIVTKVLRACIDCCHSNNELFGGGIFLGRSEISSNGQSHDDSEEAEYCNRCTAIRLVRLFVVREKGQPDCAADLLRRPERYYSVQELQIAMATDGMAPSFVAPEHPPQVPQRLKSLYSSTNVSAGSSVKRTSAALSGDAPDRASVPVMQPVCDRSMKPKIPLRLGSLRAEPTNQRHSNQSPVVASRHAADSRRGYQDNNSSSSSEEDTPRARRQKRSVSRKGSSSTTSYQSIPDVAASANSSLQRLRASSLRNSGCAANGSPQLVNDSLDHQVLNLEQLALVDTSDVMSSTSCEENTSENEDDSDFALHRKLDDLARIDRDDFRFADPELVMSLPETNLCGTLSSPSAECIPGTSFSSLSAVGGEMPCVRQPVAGMLQVMGARGRSQGLSEIFASDLNFIDDNNESGHDSDGNAARNFSPPVSRETRLDMPELVKDGTLPKQGGVCGRPCGLLSLEKPDIYPSADEFADAEPEEQCGKYFFCTLSKSSTQVPDSRRPLEHANVFSAASGAGSPEVTDLESEDSSVINDVEEPRVR